MSKIVKIRNAGAGKYLNIHGSNVTSLTPHQNVTIWEDSGSNEQKWQVDGATWALYTGPIRSVVNLSYGLNVYRSGNPYNCDVYPVSGKGWCLRFYPRRDYLRSDSGHEYLLCTGKINWQRSGR